MFGKFLGSICFPCLLSNLAIGFALGVGWHFFKKTLEKQKAPRWMKVGIEEATKQTIKQVPLRPLLK